MRVLHVYSGNLYGGIESMLVTLAGCQDHTSVATHEFALCFEGRLSRELDALDAKTHMLGAVRVSRPLSILRARKNLRKVLRSFEFDAVICHAPWPHAIFARVVRNAGVPLVFWLHGAIAKLHWTERWAAMTKPDLAICNSKFSARSLPRLWPNVRSEVLYCPVLPLLATRDQDKLSALRAEMQTSEGMKVVLQVSRIEPLKGHAVLLEALSLLRDRSDWVCWIVGGAQRKQEVRLFDDLKRLAERLNISDRVRFAGERTDVSRFMMSADIYCQPNVGPESFGITLIEALSAELPVVASSIGGALEIVDESCGLFVEPNSPRSVADAIELLLNDDALRLKLGKAGPMRAKELSNPEATLVALENLIARLN